MSPETVENCFDKFWQADGTGTRRFGGTGIGLYIVRSLIEAMGGAVSVRSRPTPAAPFRCGSWRQRVTPSSRYPGHPATPRRCPDDEPGYPDSPARRSRPAEPRQLGQRDGSRDVCRDFVEHRRIDGMVGVGEVQL